MKRLIPIILCLLFAALVSTSTGCEWGDDDGGTYEIPVYEPDRLSP